MTAVTRKAINGNNYHALQLRRFGRIEECRMVGRLTPLVKDLELPAGVERSAPHDSEEVARRQRSRARTRHEHSAGFEHFDRAQVDLFVATRGGFGRALAACERRRVEDDLAEGAAGVTCIAEIIEAVRLDDGRVFKPVALHVRARETA